MNSKTLYEEIVEAGIVHDNHSSDLYFPVTSQSREILARHPHVRYSVFTGQTDNLQWFDCAFQYTPYWEKRGAK